MNEVGSGYNFYGHYVSGYPDDDIAMIRGDVVSINWHRDSSNDSDHTEFGVGLGQSLPQGEGYSTRYGDLIDQHTNERHKAIWNCRDRKALSDMVYTVFRVWHLSDSVS